MLAIDYVTGRFLLPSDCSHNFFNEMQDDEKIKIHTRKFAGSQTDRLGDAEANQLKKMNVSGKT